MLGYPLGTSWVPLALETGSKATSKRAKTLDILRKKPGVLRRRGLVVPPPALEEPPDAAVRAGGEPGRVRELDLDGAAGVGEQGPGAARRAEAALVREAGAHHAGGHHGRVAGGAAVLREPRGARR